MKFFLLLAICIGSILTAPQYLYGQSGSSKKSKATSEAMSLFDGKSMEHFRGYKSEEIGKGWKVEDGTLMFDGSGGGDIMTKEKFSDFDLTFEWKVSEGGNSGVMYRVTTGDNAPYLSGPEFQILDDKKHKDGKNYLTSAGSLYGLYNEKERKLEPVGSWNNSRIVQKGNMIEHWLNGQKIVTARSAVTIGKNESQAASSRTGKSSVPVLRGILRSRIMETNSGCGTSKSNRRSNPADGGRISTGAWHQQ